MLLILLPQESIPTLLRYSEKNAFHLSYCSLKNASPCLTLLPPECMYPHSFTLLPSRHPALPQEYISAFFSRCSLKNAFLFCSQECTTCLTLHTSLAFYRPKNIPRIRLHALGPTLSNQDIVSCLSNCYVRALL